MKRRGAPVEETQLARWAPGFVPGQADARLFRLLTYRRGASLNGVARPVEGVVALVDLRKGAVVDFLDRDPVVPVPQDSGDFFDPGYLGPPRPPLRPLVTSEPEGANFEVRGQEVRWQNWRFRVGLHPREGLVLHAVAYQDGGRLRPILHRASLAEMVVPYGDPDGPLWAWRNAF